MASPSRLPIYLSQIPPASTAPGVVGVAYADSAAGTASSLTVNLGQTGWQPGDLAILVAVANPASQTFTKPSGWTQIRDATANNERMYLAWRALVAGDTS